ncbi:uncharacterized protein PAN0_016d5292 [Moesziomyces antarcticus]|uniref:Uncharacterized protein n=2 Tax=Pseudozyma antarctica TaxID=84753 RepID=A0A081CK70_PSEA2|nr:uncharacterized protein PAN0_016d5292 [Moesziomyces antarcticus]GAK67066.1 conserved hypothetical protein [Moesziomyces antarcticus]SPO48315.1 uncharacterized protein PSANT_06004 [Moesziomyces antarcticus]
MASQAHSSDAEAPRMHPMANVSIARFIPRFTKPLLLTTHIPSYRHSFSPPVQERQAQAESSSSLSSAKNPNHSESKQIQTTDDADDRASSEYGDGASYVEWNKLLPIPSNLLGGSFQDLFAASKSNTRCTAPPPRLVFFGEQHHQPHVMRAQLQTLHALHAQCQQASSADHAPTSTPPIYRLHLILEHFSVLDQGMLHSFSQGRMGPDELAHAYHAHSEESFHIGHYMPLLMLAKELDVPIWGGFPPRRWARQVFRNGVDAVKSDEHKRSSPESSAAETASDPTVSKLSGAGTPRRSPLFTAWSSVTNISAAHRSYLSGLMRPDLPPRFPPISDAATSAAPALDRPGQPTIYPTWLLQPQNVELKGFGPAQALKDSYLAHVTAWILRGARDAEPSAPASQGGSGKDRPVVNVALVVCGLGHCEYGFGAPERVVQLLSQHSPAEGEWTRPYIIASKPLDSGIWLGYEHAQSKASAQEHDAGKQETATRAEVQQWLSDPWARKMADAVVLYDWIDEPTNEGEAETKANDNAHVNPTPPS